MESETTKKVLVKDIMTEKVMTTYPEVSLLDVAKILSEHNFNGMPVVDKENHCIGIITEFDLIDKASEITIETLRTVLKDVYTSKSEGARLQSRSKEIYPLKVSDIMTKEVITISPDATFEELIRLFREYPKINPIPVVDKESKLTGLVSRSDILKPLDIYRLGMSP